MKSISINKTILSGWVLACTVLFTACTDSFEKWNIDPNAATEEDMTHDNLNTGAYLTQMERGIFIVGENLGGRYQEVQALEGDLFASYLATITTWGYTTYHNDHYSLYSDWYDKPFNDAYTNVMQPWKSICEKTDEGSPARALATIITVCTVLPICTDLSLTSHSVLPYRLYMILRRMCTISSSMSWIMPSPC